MKKLVYLYKALIFIMTLSVIVSLYQLYCFEYETGVFKADFFTQNDNYTVIFFGFADETHLRLPGIFESGKSNSTFISVVLLLIYIMDIKSGKRNKYILFGLGGVVCLLCFTRRPIVVFIATILFVEILWSLKTRRISSILYVGVVVFVAVLLTLFNKIVSYFSADSLFARFENWGGVLEILSSRSFAELFFGNGYLQESVENGVISDSMYLSIFLFGGASFLVMFVGGLTSGLFFQSRKFLVRNDRGAMVNLAAASLFFYVLVSGFLGNVWSNFGESFVFYYALPFLLRASEAAENRFS